MGVAYDDDGTVMTQRIINTLCPIEFLSEGREICLYHMTEIEGFRHSATLEDMLPDSVYNIETGELTHMMCSRNGYDNTVRKVWETMIGYTLNGHTWVHDEAFFLEDSPNKDLVKSKVGIIIGDTPEVLNYLGLEIR